MVSDVNLKPLSTTKLIRNIEDNALDYKYFTIRRINCQYQDENEKSSFRANVKSIKDEAIVVSFNKLNIPFGRVFLTPDSVKFINYIDKNYFIGDYDFIREIFNVSLDFYDVQALLSNDIFSYKGNDEDKEFRKFSSRIDSGRYVLQSLNERKLSKIDEKSKLQKADRIQKRTGLESFILETITVLPGNYNVEKILIDDRSNKQSVKFAFSDYTQLKKKDFPGEITMDFSSEKGDIHMRLRLAGFSTDKIEKPEFSIPKRYERLILR